MQKCQFRAEILEHSNKHSKAAIAKSLDVKRNIANAIKIIYSALTIAGAMVVKIVKNDFIISFNLFHFNFDIIFRFI